MRIILTALCMASLLIATVPAPTEASTMQNACMKSDRKAKSRKMCRCMQSVANQELSKSDQKLAASFFKEPHKAQEIRQSDRRSHEQFWERYKEFGAVFAATCGHLK